MEIGNVNRLVPVGSSPSNTAGPQSKIGTSQSVDEEAELTQQELQDPEIQRKKVQEVVEKMNQMALIFDRSLRFQIHDKTKSMMVSVIDSVSNRVIREIPPKEILELFAKMQDFIGMIFDKRV